MFSIGSLLDSVPWGFVILCIVILLPLVAFGIFSMIANKGSSDDESDKNTKAVYRYEKKKFFLTRAEREFYGVLTQVVGNEYEIFAQVHLSSVLDEKINGQDWRAARAHINRKSVDFLLCNKQYLNPLLAIELDDKSHERLDRIERDSVVEGILKQAGLPLLRIANNGGFDPAAISNQIREVLGQK